jgi:hypothetical protein
LQLDARSSHSIHLLIELDDFFGTRVIVNQGGICHAAFVSQGFDLPVNQLKYFTFDSGGWVRHHKKFSAQIVADEDEYA